jgi:hypothetical protein
VKSVVSNLYQTKWLSECVQHTHFTNRCVFWSCPDLYCNIVFKISFKVIIDIRETIRPLKNIETATVHATFLKLNYKKHD